MMKIDFHCHCDVSDPEKIKAFVRAYEERDVIACMVGGRFYGGHDMVPNEEVIEICARYPGRLYPLAKIDLWSQAPDPAELHYFAEKGVKGFKFIYPYYEYDHDLYMPIYEEAEKIGLPVLFHTGRYRPSQADRIHKRPVLRNMDPITLDRIARSFQDLHIVMAHLGTGLWRIQAAELVKTHANLYADLAGSGSWMTLSAEEIAELLGAPRFVQDKGDHYFDKLVFGSDSYTSNPRPFTEGIVHYEMKLRKIGVSDATEKLVMGETAASWIGLK